METPTHDNAENNITCTSMANGCIIMSSIVVITVLSSGLNTVRRSQWAHYDVTLIPYTE